MMSTTKKDMTQIKLETMNELLVRLRPLIEGLLDDLCSLNQHLSESVLDEQEQKQGNLLRHLEDALMQIHMAQSFLVKADQKSFHQGVLKKGAFGYYLAGNLPIEDGEYVEFRADENDSYTPGHYFNENGKPCFWTLNGVVKGEVGMQVILK